jgi:hypothetical protein
MKRCALRLSAFLLVVVVATLVSGVSAQQRQSQPLGLPDPLDRKLPDGKTLRDGIVKADYEKNREDAAELVRLTAEVRDEFESGDRYVVSVKMLKKLEDVEKLAKDIRNRLRRR